MKLLKGPNTTAKLRAARVITHTRVLGTGPAASGPSVAGADDCRGEGNPIELRSFCTVCFRVFVLRTSVKHGKYSKI